MNLRKAIDDIKEEYGICDEEFAMDFSEFLVQNRWFGQERKVQNGEVIVNNNFFELSPISEYIENYGVSLENRISILQSRFKASLPDTDSALQKYIESVKMCDEDMYAVIDFLCYYFPTEIFEITQDELDEIVEIAYDTLNKRHWDLTIGFFNWCKQKKHSRGRKVKYTSIYVSDKRSEQNNDAYNESEYLTMIYHFFNEEYIQENDMFAQAARSSKYANAWLFLCLHFVDALRDTDLIRIKHPDLPMEPEEVLRQVEEGTFSSEDARSTLYSVYWYLEYMMLKPNKTKKYNVPKINFHVPVSLEEHIGKLFAVVEAHARIDGKEDEDFLKPVKSYEEISRAMGEEIGELFLDSNFRSRSSNKSFMQLIETITDEILGNDSEFHVKGYMLASLARSHKGSYGDFAKTTTTYLKDARLSGFTAEWVAREMLERGVLSFVPMMLLEMVGGNDFSSLNAGEQTKVLGELDMSLVEINDASTLAQLARQQSANLAKTIYSKASKEEVMDILHRIGNGEAASKHGGCLCMLTAMRNECAFPDKKSCLGCTYEVSTRSTVYMLTREYIRLSEQYKNSDNEIIRKKSGDLLKGTIIPCISTIVNCVSAYNLASGRSLKEIVNAAAENVKQISK